jgi:hypothetical protein
MTDANAPDAIPLIEQFLALSRVLTGEQHLNAGLAQANFKAIAELPAARLTDVLDAYAQKLAAGMTGEKAARSLLDDDALSGTIAQIIVLWFTGATFDPKSGGFDNAGAAQYAGALMWEPLGAHPPGYSKGYFGHWKYPAR